MVLAPACGRGSNSPFPEGVVSIDGTELSVWVADDSRERRQGLMGVEDLPGGVDGMLFAFPEPSPAAFHMRNTLIELDIWWFDASGTLIGSQRMEPCLTEPCPTYQAPGSITWALETPAGRRSFEPGDLLSIVENE